MGRPKKTGMDYFPHDVTARFDERIKLIEAAFSHAGYSTYFKLLERIYATKSGMLDLSDPDMRAVIAQELNLSGNEFEAITAAMVKRGLFDADAFSRWVLTSARVQETMRSILEWRERSEKKSKEKKRKEKEIPEEIPEETSEETPKSPQRLTKPKAPNYKAEFIGTEPVAGDGALPPALVALFESQGKEEAYKNIWLTEAQFDALSKRYGEDRVDWAAKQVTDWSLSLDVSAKTNLAGWQSYRLKRDHAAVLRNQILRRWPELKGEND